MGESENQSGFPELYKSALRELSNQAVISRIWNKDHTVWKPDPTEIANRLGWLDCPTTMGENVAGIGNFVSEVRASGFTRAILLGMGGSSLAPEVFRRVFGVSPGYLDLTVLDSTHPHKILEIQHGIKPESSLFIVSTKSGGTVETLSLMKYFYSYMAEQRGSGKAGDHFVAITDPGSGLETAARDLKFRKTFLNDPDIGGRYAALSYFGLVPAALIGVDLSTLLDGAGAMSDLCASEEGNPGAALGVFMGETAINGRDKLTLILSPAIAPFGAWVEQLIAESTGKDGKGILPVIEDEVMPPSEYSLDRSFVYSRLGGDDMFDDGIGLLRKAGNPVFRINIGDTYDLGAEYFRWEFATAIAGWSMGIQPFDQPNVESAKILAREMVSAFEKQGSLPESEPDLTDDNIEVFGQAASASAAGALANFLESSLKGAAANPYVAVQAYLKPSLEIDLSLGDLKTKIQSKFKRAVTVGYGPRYLHSTGQLHKGDGGNGIFIIMTDDPSDDPDIPDAPAGRPGVSFGVLIRAQALGDQRALQAGGRRVIRLHFVSETTSGLSRLAREL